MYLFELLVFKIYVFIIFGCAGSLLLHRLFSSFSKEGLLSGCGVQTSPCGGFSCEEHRLLSMWASVVVACGLSSCSSWAASLVAQRVKNLPAGQETLVLFLGWEVPLEKG